MDKQSARSLVSAVAGPLQGSDNRKSWLDRAARRTGISFRTIRSIWHGEITNERHLAVRILQEAANTRAKALAQRFEEIARAMESTDAAAHVEDIAALVHAVRLLRGLDGTRDGET